MKMKIRHCYIKDNLCYIPLNNGKEAFTDKEYFEKVNKYNWRGNGGVIKTNINNKNLTLQKLLFPEIKTKIKHINNNYYDCRKANIKPMKRECYIENDICYIPLQNGELAFCDADRFDEVNQYNWRVIYHKQKIICVSTSVMRKGMMLHRFLYPEWKIIDHINHNKLDNTSKNLREVTMQQNAMNRSTNYNNKSGYKGVYYNKQRKIYRVRIGFNNKPLYLGTYKTKEEAALAYNEKAKELFGEYAFLNVIS